MSFVEHVRGHGSEEVHVGHLNNRGSLNPVGRVAVGGHVKGFISVFGAVNAVGDGKLVVGIKVEIEFEQAGCVPNRAVHWVAIILVDAGLEEIEQRQPLAVGIAGERDQQRFICEDCRGCNRAGGGTGLDAQVRAGKFRDDLLERAEEEGLVLYYRATDGGAELFAGEILERLVVGGVGAQFFMPLEVKDTAVNFVGAGLGNDVYHSTGGAAKLGAGARGNHLEFLDGVHGDVNLRALAADLFAEEAVVVVAAVEADVVEDAALAVEGDFIAVRALHDADAGGEGEQVFKLAAQHRGGFNGKSVEGRTRFGFGGVHRRGAGNHDGFLHRRNLQGDGEGEGLSDRHHYIFLQHGGEA